MTLTTERRTDSPEWILCPGCRTAVYHKRWARNLDVCRDCGHHERLTAPRRLAALLDEGTMRPIEPGVRTADVLNFTDSKPYPDRIRDARARTGLDEAVVCARGQIRGSDVIVAVMDFRFLGGSLGSAVGELVTIAADTALTEATPLLLVTASGGARMQEGAVALMQMAKTSAALSRLDDAGVLTLSLITDPTYGGVAASFATLTDVLIAEPGARLGFAGRRVIEQTIRQQLPPDFQTAEFLLAHGFLDMIVPRHELRREIGRLLRIGNAATAGARTGGRHPDGDPVVRDPGRLPELDSWDAVRTARDLRRPTTADYLALAFTDFQELHGDRLSGDCAAVVVGTAWLDDRPVVVVGQQKGHDPAELAHHNFGMPTPAGYRKAARAMRLAAKLGVPLITLVDTPGAYPGASAEEQGQSVAVAENIKLMTTLPVPVVSVITGEGGSGGALALATANQVLICSQAVYSVISPEGCAAILWHDPAAARTAAYAMGIDARNLLLLGVVDGVIPEPDGGAGADSLLAADRVRAALLAALAGLDRCPPEELVSQRHARFRRFAPEPDVGEMTEVTR
ncbi:MAG TPA: acetyl-CoA carboxylase, carboxyltransferase subunit beta [Pseudonocardiaceae bacterium]|jgi:acetyl-CoA carboxylase carboxyl transferase subunit beta|nr:acetyl-CoA carboxylase, carboxyltransferase subunit beta [Pseudonocardiaceae bacterium]